MWFFVASSFTFALYLLYFFLLLQVVESKVSTVSLHALCAIAVSLKFSHIHTTISQPYRNQSIIIIIIFNHQSSNQELFLFGITFFGDKNFN